MFIALSCAFIGALCLYLSSPHQALLAAPMAAMPARVAGALGLCASLYWLCLTMQALAACFVFLTVLMTLLVALPYCAALLRMARIVRTEVGNREARRHG